MPPGGAVVVALSEFEIVLASAGGAEASAQLPALRALFPQLSDVHLRFALGSTGGASSSAERAAAFLLERGDGAVEAEVAAALAAQARRQGEEGRRRALDEARGAAQAKAAALARYDERPDDAGVVHRPSLPREMLEAPGKKDKVIKWLDGRPLHMKASEKFFVEAPPQQPQGEMLKMRKKGSGGMYPRPNPAHRPNHPPTHPSS